MSEPPFNGCSEHTLDAKGRVFVPKRIGQRLGVDGAGQRGVVLSPGMNRCINVYGPDQWAAARARLENQPYTDANKLAMQRFVFGNTFDGQLDSSSRLLIPERLRGYASLTDEVALVGVGERFEIWNSEAWRSYEATALAQFDEFAPAWANGNGGAGGGAPGAPGVVH